MICCKVHGHLDPHNVFVFEKLNVLSENLKNNKFFFIIMVALIEFDISRQIDERVVYHFSDGQTTPQVFTGWLGPRQEQHFCTDRRIHPEMQGLDRSL